MLAIQAIYLDRVSQLKETALKKGASANESDDGGYDRRYSVPGNRGPAYGEELHQYPRQQYQPQPYQSPILQPHYQQSHQPPSQMLQRAPSELQRQQQYQLQHHQSELQHRDQQDSGFRLFGKKRSKTQPSAPQPPEFGHTAAQRENSGNFNHQSMTTGNSGNGPNGYGSYGGYGNPGNEVYLAPYMDAQMTPTPLPAQPATELPQEQSAKSSKWRPFGKKKSKSMSTKVESSGAYSPQKEGLQVVPVHASTLESNAVRHLVDPSDHADTYLHGHSDWYVENAPDDEDLYDDEYESQDVYYDGEDEDVDPFYTADTKGRALAFEGQDSGAVEKKPDTSEEETQINGGKPLSHIASSYSEDQIFPSGLEYSQADLAALSTQYDSQDQESGVLADERAYTSNYTDDALDDDDDVYQDMADSSVFQQQPYPEADEPSVEKEEEQQVPEQPKVNQRAPFTSAFVETTEDIQAGLREEPALAKTKSRRTWFGKKKKEKEKENDRLDNVAKMMDEALFGGSAPRKPSKDKLNEKSSVASLTKTLSHTSERQEMPRMELEPQSQLQSGPQPELEPQDQPELESQYQPELEPQYQPELEPQYQPELEPQYQPELEHLPETEDQQEPQTNPDEHVPDVMAEDLPMENGVINDEQREVAEEEVGELGETPAKITENAEDELDITQIGQDAKSITSETKRSKSRILSIFKSKKDKNANQQQQQLEQQQQQESVPLSPTMTNEDAKSMNSSQTRKSIQINDRKAAEMAAALAVRPKEKKRNSDEYIPYEYQEDLEGPLMERVEVRENRDIIGFVLPVEEFIDFTQEGNEDAALENWDSWVSQLESFEKILSDKGLKKDKAKKPKKVKEPKPAKDDPSSPLGSAKANRSSIFGIGRSDTVKSRTTLDLTSQPMDNRPPSLNTTFMDDSSVVPRQSFQSSRSGDSEAYSPSLASQQVKKRWWSPKHRDTPSIYRVSNSFSTADLEQDRHLSMLLLSQDQVRSIGDLTLNTQIMSLPITLTEPSTPAPGLVKETPASVETASVEVASVEIASVEIASVEVASVEVASVEAVPEEETEKTEQKKDEQEDEPDEAPIAPMPKAKSKSNKPKLLPISTPLPQLLKMDNAEELWLYVLQAKTYATGRMNKGDKRSAAIALKRAQALEARWQEVLLEMASSDEGTDELLEDEDDDEEEESGEETVVVPVVPVKKEKKKETTTAAAPTTAATTVLPNPTTITTNTHNTLNDVDEEDEEEESYAAQRRKSTISRSSSTPDKYSKYKVNKSAATSPNVSTSLPIVAEEETNEEGELSVNPSAAASTPAHDDGRLGPNATMEQMIGSTNEEHLKFYIQRMKTDTVAKARNGSKFAALEGMKNVKILQQRLGELQEAKEAKEDKGDIADEQGKEETPEVKPETDPMEAKEDKGDSADDKSEQGKEEAPEVKPESEAIEAKEDNGDNADDKSEQEKEETHEVKLEAEAKDSDSIRSVDSFKDAIEGEEEEEEEEETAEAVAAKDE
ncbi:hypothetical protein BGZ58_005875 [Dissophora ornata]|nr:hypothetical protein BGZ58_005875 [Dissophora ornata]